MVVREPPMLAEGSAAMPSTSQPRLSSSDGIASPVGGAVVCYTYRAFGLPIPADVLRDRAQDTVEILCFVPPWPTS